MSRSVLGGAMLRAGACRCWHIGPATGCRFEWFWVIHPNHDRGFCVHAGHFVFIT